MVVFTALILNIVLFNAGVYPASSQLDNRMLPLSDREPITVESVSDVRRDGQHGNEIWLAGLSSLHSGTEVNSTTLRLVHRDAGWFSDWELQLAARPGVLPKEFVDGSDQYDEWIILEVQKGLIKSGEYLSRISYDPEGYRLSVFVRRTSEDVVDVVANVEISHAILEDLIDSVTDNAAAAFDHMRSFTVERNYKKGSIPLALSRQFSWRFIEFVDRVAQNKSGFEYSADDVPGVRVEWPSTPVPGRLDIRVVQNETHYELDSITWTDRPEHLMFSLADLPMGESTIQLVYVQDDRSEVLGSGRIRIIQEKLSLVWDMIDRTPGEGVNVRIIHSPFNSVPVVPIRISAEFAPDQNFGTRHEPVRFSQDVDVRQTQSAEEAISYVQIPIPYVGGTLKLRADSHLPGVVIVGNTASFDLQSPPAIRTMLSDRSMSSEIGLPAILPPGSSYPTIDINVDRAGIVRGELIRNGTSYMSIPEEEVEAGEFIRLDIDGQATEEGHHEVRLWFFDQKLNETVYDTMHFTVLDPDRLQTRDSRVAYVGPEGQLIYAPDFRGNRIPDFSHAGYGGGGVALPDVDTKVVLYPSRGAGDDTERIQQAIDEVARLPLDDRGLRGALLLKKGHYHIEDTLLIHADGVVIRGEGDGEDGTVLIATGQSIRPLINVNGPYGCIVQEEIGAISDLYVPVGARSFRVEGVGNLAIGDTIVIRRYGNADWISEIGMDRIIPSRSAPERTTQWTPFHLDFERVVTDVYENQVTVDAPIVNSIESIWGGGSVFKCSDHRISQIGVESLRGVSQYDPDITEPRGGSTYRADENHATWLVSMQNVKNAWVRDVTAFHFTQGVVTLKGGVKWTTVQDASSFDMVSLLAGSRRYPFDSNGQLNLMHRLYSESARHAFAFGARVTGPNVFLFAQSEGDFHESEPHHRWSVGGLFDNVRSRIAIQDRQSYGSGHGWAGANYVAWNTAGTLVVQWPPTAQNWAIGHVGDKLPGAFVDRKPELTDGYWESHGNHVHPQSLYIQQLQDRLGIQAVVNIGYDRPRVLDSKTIKLLQK